SDPRTSPDPPRSPPLGHSPPARPRGTRGRSGRECEESAPSLDNLRLILRILSALDGSDEPLTDLHAVDARPAKAAVPLQVHRHRQTDEPIGVDPERHAVLPLSRQTLEPHQRAQPGQAVRSHSADPTRTASRLPCKYACIAALRPSFQPRRYARASASLNPCTNITRRSRFSCCCNE